jgi:4-amino-4-deoxy-L-arabinose transferase-like glycosyltransferase
LATAVPVVVAALLFLPLIGQRALFISDEARYALLARNMVEHGHWLVPHIGDEVHMEKPPGYAWAIALIALLQGGVITELASVLPAALSGIGTVAMTAALGRRLFGATAGLVAGLVLATSFGFFIHARMALADMTITCCVVGSFWAFWRADAEPARAGRFMALFYGFLALGLSAKGPYALMPILVLALFLVGDGGWRRLAALRPATGVLVLGAVISPWAVAFARHQQSYVREVVVGDFSVHFGLWEGLHEILFPFGPLGLEFLPWAVLLPAAVVAGYGKRADDAARRRLKFLACWALTYVVLVTLSSHKRDRYLLAVYPALALMIGWLLCRWQTRGDARSARLPALICAAMAVAGAVAFFLPLPVRDEFGLYLPATTLTALAPALMLVAGGVAVVVAVRAGRIVDGFVALALALAFVLAYGTRLYVPRYNEMYDVKRFSALLNEHVPAGAPLVSFGYARLSIDLYSRREPILMRHATTLRSLLRDRGEVYVFGERRGWRIIEEANVGTWETLAEFPLAGRVVTLARGR